MDPYAYRQHNQVNVCSYNTNDIEAKCAVNESTKAITVNDEFPLTYCSQYGRVRR